jgi:dihydroflavonol-4-reductase
MSEGTPRAVITGATGLLGSNLAVHLLERGWRVSCTRRASSQVDHLRDWKIDWVEGDVTDRPSLERAFAGADAVFHCAAQISFLPEPSAAMLATNVEGTRKVLEAARQAGVRRVVHCSSIVACAVSRNGSPVDETHAWNFPEVGLKDAYSYTKHLAEKVVQAAVAAGSDAVIVNPGYIFGPMDPKPSSGKLIIDVANRKIPGIPSGYNNYVDVRDVCAGMVAAWEKGRTGERYILGGEDMSYGEVFKLIADIAGVKPPPFPLPFALAMTVGWAGDLAQKLLGKETLLNSTTIRYSFLQGYRFTSAKAERELGYRHGPISRAITDALAWFKRRGMLKR